MLHSMYHTQNHQNLKLTFKFTQLLEWLFNKLMLTQRENSIELGTDLNDVLVNVSEDNDNSIRNSLLPTTTTPWSKRKKLACCCCSMPPLFCLAFFVAFIFIAYIPISNPIPTPDWALGKYKTDETIIEIGGFHKKSGSQTAWAMFPITEAGDESSPTQFPLLSYSHGDGGGGFMVSLTQSPLALMKRRNIYEPQLCDIN